MPQPAQPLLLVHGGAWAIPEAMRAAHEAGVRSALSRGYALLKAGASAIDAVTAAITILEDDETFDAGRGAFLTRDGRVQLDALLMEGATLRAGGVACVERLRNPIQTARLVLERSPHVYFVGTGAEEFAASHGIPLISNRELVVLREIENLRKAQAREQAGMPDTSFAGSSPQASVFLREAQFRASGQDHDRDHDTVGAVALDVHGNLAAGTSTGGTLNKTPGRVGDSSLIGCGCYADNESAAVSLTGWGEPIMKLVLGKWAVDRVGAGAAPQQAATDAIAYLFRRLGGYGGLILMDQAGQVGIAHNTPGMAWGLATQNGMRAGLAAPAGF